MGATKLTNYTNRDLKLSRYGKILAHPARIQMVRELLKTKMYRNLDLAMSLNLSRTTIKFHLGFFIEAKLVDIHYFEHFYLIQIKEDKVNLVTQFLEQIELFEDCSNY